MANAKPSVGRAYFAAEQAGREARRASIELPLSDPLAQHLAMEQKTHEVSLAINRASMSEIMDMADEAYSAAMRKCDDVERKLSYPKLKKAAEAGNRIEPKGAKRG